MSSRPKHLPASSVQRDETPVRRKNFLDANEQSDKIMRRQPEIKIHTIT